MYIRRQAFIMMAVIGAILAGQAAQFSWGAVGPQVEVKPTAAPPGALNDLRNKAATKRREAANRLGALRATDAVRPLVGALSDADASVREAAAFALGQIADSGAVGPLLRLLGDGDVETRASTAFALGMIGDEKAIRALSDALTDSESEVRGAAIVGLGLMQDAEAVDEIIEALKDPSFDVRYDAAWALGRIGEPDSVDELRAALANPGDVRLSPALREAFRQTAQAALARIDEEQGGASEPGAPGRPRRVTRPPAEAKRSGRAARGDKDKAKANRSRQVKATVAAAPTERAMREHVTGAVGVRVLVSMSGHPVRAYVIRRLGYGLDQRAVEAVMFYTFDPGQQNGYSQNGWLDLDVKF